MLFERTCEIAIPDCSPEALVDMVWKLADGLPRESHLVSQGEGVLGDIGWSSGFMTAELARLTALDVQEKGDLRGKTLLCVETNIVLTQLDQSIASLRENGFFPSAQGFMATILEFYCREIASLPLSDGNGGRVIWYTKFSPGSAISEDPDSRSFNTLPLEKVAQSGFSVMNMLAFKIKE